MTEINVPRAEHFREGAKEALDYLILGEESAKEMLMINAILGQNALLVGDPGGGKTTAAKHFYKIFNDISPDTVAVVPPLPDLRPEQLVGAAAVACTSIKTDNGTTKEVRTTSLEPIIRGTAQVIFADEIKRTNPYAIDAILGALDPKTRALVTTAGTIALPNLQFGIATLNQHSSPDASFNVDAATASRFAMGAVLGGSKTDKEARKARIIEIGVKRWDPNPEAIKPFTSTGDLTALRADADKVVFSEGAGGLDDRYAELCVRAVDALYSFKKSAPIGEADGRIAGQIARMARVLSLLHGHQTVQEDRLNQAVDYAVTARLGSLTRASFTEIQDVVGTITA